MGLDVRVHLLYSVNTLPVNGKNDITRKYVGDGRWRTVNNGRYDDAGICLKSSSSCRVCWTGKSPKARMDLDEVHSVEVVSPDVVRHHHSTGPVGCRGRGTVRPRDVR